MVDFMNTINITVFQFHSILLILLVILHILIATGIARDIGSLAKRQIPPLMLSPSIWVLAGLLTGIWGLLVYWLIHHSSLSR